MSAVPGKQGRLYLLSQSGRGAAAWPAKHENKPLGSHPFWSWDCIVVDRSDAQRILLLLRDNESPALCLTTWGTTFSSRRRSVGSLWGSMTSVPSPTATECF